MNEIATAALFWLASVSQSQIALQEPQWSGSVVARETTLVEINQTPMPNRHYRPLHIYGNTVRRVYYRGNPLPTPRDVWNTWRSLRY